MRGVVVVQEDRWRRNENGIVERVGWSCEDDEKANVVCSGKAHFSFPHLVCPHFFCTFAFCSQEKTPSGESSSCMFVTWPPEFISIEYFDFSPFLFFFVALRYYWKSALAV
eukprot:TRINITY_DN630_c0_g1_i6.p2 TRINITY_DN630_c0_g1~~TRINITY_DN630_c0_g1_i6.p2  ORF type:complete len:111 (-),score=1.14 TRINITY_DN630_c0_g1_i6:323-655(-)